MSKNLFKSKRAKIYLTLSLLIFVIPGLLLYSSSRNTEERVTSDDGLLIPQEHLANKFNYLEFSNSETKDINQKKFAGFNLKNASYIYDLVDIQLTVNIYADEEQQDLINSEILTVDMLSSQEEITIEHEIVHESDEQFWWAATPQSLDLRKK